ncbi:MAG: hypothetical protein E7133_01235 [Rikenellaceae bacterium]|nr:hypothetical protein [Rikenellaceae bacterium]
MGLFTPHKPHARKFNYTPRYYDPAKEEWDERRAERGDALSAEGELRPGDRIRMRRDARRRRRAEEEGQNRKSKFTRLIILLAVVGGAIWALTSVANFFEPKDEQNKQYAESEPLSDTEQMQVVDGVVFDGGQTYEITDNEGNPLSEEEVAKMFDEKLQKLEQMERE